MLRILLVPIFLLLSAGIGHAAVCSVTISDVVFGTIDSIGNTDATTSADISVSCEGVTPGTDTITMCGGIGAGSGGSAGGVRLGNGTGGGTLSFGLYATAGSSMPWGNGTLGLGPPQEIDVPVSGTNANTTAHLHAIIARGQSTAPVGDYSSTFTGADVDFKYAEGPLNCDSPGGADETTTTFTVSASVPANCLLQTSDLDFGTTGLIGHAIDAQTDMGVTCTPGTGYSITIDGGSAADPTHRQMHSGDNSVSYDLYSDQTRQAPWGTAPIATVSDNGDGSKQQHRVYGRIPPQRAVSGSYSDTVVVTIAY